MFVMSADNSLFHMAPPPGARQEADVRNRAEGDEGGEAPLRLSERLNCLCFNL